MRHSGPRPAHHRDRRRSDASPATRPLLRQAAHGPQAKIPGHDNSVAAHRTLPARHGDNPGHDVSLLQRLSSRHDEPNLRAGCDQNHIGPAVRGIGQDVCALAQAIRRGTLRAIERRHILARQNQCNGVVSRFQRDPPSDSSRRLHRALLVGYRHSGRLEISESRKRSMGRWIQIRRTANQCRQSRRNGIHDLPTGNASGHALLVAGKAGISLSHPSGNSPCMACTNASARSGNARPYAEILSFHSVSADFPRSIALRKCSPAFAGM